MELPKFIADALEAVYGGSTGDALETQWLDFKEDPAVHEQEKNPDARLVETLLDTAVCLANGVDDDTHIVLGISDKKAGQEAFTGTSRRALWLEDKIMKGTVPPLRVEAEEFLFRNTPLVWIRIPRGMRFYERTKGQATYRVGKLCKPATSEIRRAIELRRLNPDYTALASHMTVSDLDPLAIEFGRKLWLQRNQARGDIVERPTTETAFLRELGLLDSRDRVTIAAELLFSPQQNGRISARLLKRAIPGAEPKDREFGDPLVILVGKLTEAIKDGSSSEIARVDLGGGQETSIPAFPAQAVDEAVVNALVHRDWALLAPVVIDQTPRTLQVTSPGSLPFGVDPERLLTTHSVPRNATLMRAFRRLGLAEESSRGFDRMWAAMLRSGREVPEVIATDSFVSVRISAGKPDANFIRGLMRLAEDVPEEVVTSVYVLVILAHLYRNPTLTWQELLAKTGIGEMEARELVDLLVEHRILVAHGERLPQWSLSSQAAKSFSKTQVIHKPLEQWIRDQLRSGQSLTARDIANVMGVGRQEVTAILMQLRELGEVKIDPAGPQRGPTTRWIAEQS